MASRELLIIRQAKALSVIESRFNITPVKDQQVRIINALEAIAARVSESKTAKQEKAPEKVAEKAPEKVAEKAPEKVVEKVPEKEQKPFVKSKE